VAHNLINFQVDQAAVNALAANKGLIQADGGRVYMSARAAGDLAATVVNNEGVIEATGVEERDGKVFVVAEGGSVGQSGRVDVSGEDVGRVEIHAEGEIVMFDVDV